MDRSFCHKIALQRSSFRSHKFYTLFYVCIWVAYILGGSTYRVSHWRREGWISCWCLNSSWWIYESECDKCMQIYWLKFWDMNIYSDILSYEILTNASPWFFWEEEFNNVTPTLGRQVQNSSLHCRLYSQHWFHHQELYPKQSFLPGLSSSVSSQSPGYTYKSDAIQKQAANTRWLSLSYKFK